MQKPSALLLQYFPFEPTPTQARLFEAMDDFILDEKPGKAAFVLKGFAGTGKTSVIGVLVNVVRFFEYKTLLLSPTGRAAKVMSLYANRKAFTIHKVIFKQTEDPLTGKMRFARQRNYSKNTIFIVDEASMINDSAQDSSSGRGLLDELIGYVFQDPMAGNKLLLVGDTAQLPPVNQELSPALDVLHLEKNYGLRVSAHLLSEVVRQKQQSGILENATQLRFQITKKVLSIHLYTKGYRDIFRMPHERLEDGIRYAYNKFGIENTSVVCRSNRSATQYNQFIRRNLLFLESELDAGDYLMIVKNNYFWLPEDSQAGFLANGEFVEVLKVRNQEEIYGFRFADLQLRLVDYPDEPTFEAKVILNTLHSYTPALSQEDANKLYEQVLEEHQSIVEEKERNIALRKNPYLNALQIKFAYALTCHKSQGGQWQAVFVDLGYLTDQMMNVELMRWLYTAITRATDELYLMNFPPQFFLETNKSIN